jgi:hypothetical protein
MLGNTQTWDTNTNGRPKSSEENGMYDPKTGVPTAGFGRGLLKHVTYAYLNAMLSLIIAEVSLYESWVLECDRLGCSNWSLQLWLSGVGVVCPNVGASQSCFGSTGQWSLVGPTVRTFPSPLFAFISAGNSCDTAVTTWWGTGRDLAALLVAVNPLHWSGAWKRKETNNGTDIRFGIVTVA